jgi:hypothetical protein
MVYQRNQESPLWLFVGGAMLAIVAFVAAGSGADTAVLLGSLAVTLVLVGIMATFSRMTVTVGQDAVRMTFGLGWPHRTVDLVGVTDVEVMRNRWWMGFGIRYIRSGSLWNVWGSDAVELCLRTGQRLRIGTDDPQGLRDALVGRIGTR